MIRETQGNTLESLIEKLMESITNDSRWKRESDDLGVSVLGMLLYGYASNIARTMEISDPVRVNQAVSRSIIGNIGAAQKWTNELVKEASITASNPENHPGQYDLIEAGRLYVGKTRNIKNIMDNVFANIESVRQAS